jgi:hypothetical protein
MWRPAEAIKVSAEESKLPRQFAQRGKGSGDCGGNFKDQAPKRHTLEYPDDGCRAKSK